MESWSEITVVVNQLQGLAAIAPAERGGLAPRGPGCDVPRRRAAALRWRDRG